MSSFDSMWYNIQMKKLNDRICELEKEQNRNRKKIMITVLNAAKKSIRKSVLLEFDKICKENINMDLQDVVQESNGNLENDDINTIFNIVEDALVKEPFSFENSSISNKIKNDVQQLGKISSDFIECTAYSHFCTKEYFKEKSLELEKLCGQFKRISRTALMLMNYVDDYNKAFQKFAKDIRYAQSSPYETPTFHNDCNDVDKEGSIFEEVGHHLIKKYGKIHYDC